MKKEIICSRCGALGEMGPCPYDMEINNATEEEAMCDCCADCHNECCMDI